MKFHPSRLLLTSTALLISAFSLCSCGYTFQGSGSVLPPNVKKIYIPTVENNTPETSITNLLTEAIQDRFERFGVVTIVSSQEEADATLKIKVVKVRRGTASSTSRTDQNIQQDTSITIRGDLKMNGGKNLWNSAGMSSSKTTANDANAVVTSSSSFTSGSFATGALGALNQRELARGQEQEAISNICDDLAQRIYDEAVAPEF